MIPLDPSTTVINLPHNCKVLTLKYILNSTFVTANIANRLAPERSLATVVNPFVRLFNDSLRNLLLMSAAFSSACNVS